jgi:hypothetical protein
MSIDVTITHTEKGLFRKALPFDVLCANGLHYGAFDGLRLDVGEIGAEEVTLYHPDHIGRGFSAVWRKGEKDQVSLRLLSPCGAEEIDDFYDTVERIVAYWKQCNIEQDGNPLAIADVPAWRASMKDFNLATLRDCCAPDKRETLTLFCAMWPLAFGPQEKALFANAGDLSGFRDFLHVKQSIDAYYAKPSFYRSGAGILGLYTLTEDARSIFPDVPSIPFGMDQDANGNPIVVGRWVTSFYSMSEDDSFDPVDYATFIAEVPGKSYYDAEHCIIEGVHLDVIKAIVEKYGIDI